MLTNNNFCHQPVQILDTQNPPTLSIRQDLMKPGYSVRLAWLAQPSPTIH